MRWKGLPPSVKRLNKSGKLRSRRPRTGVDRLKKRLARSRRRRYGSELLKRIKNDKLRRKSAQK